MSPEPAQHRRWDDIPWERLNDKTNRRFIHGEKLMLTQLQLEEGAVVPTHHHDNEQISYVVSGSLRFWVGENEKEITVGAGDSLLLPSNLPHRVLALEDTEALDLFSPPRQDWIDKTDDYLRNA